MIDLPCPNRPQLNDTAGLGGDHESPPLWHQFANVSEVRCPADERDSVENTVVNADLVRQAQECVAVALDLEAGKLAIDYGDVDPGIMLAEPEFLDDEGSRIASMLGA